MQDSNIGSKVNVRNTPAERNSQKYLLVVWRLAISISLALLCLHAWHTFTSHSPDILMPHIVAWIQDVFILLFLAVTIHYALHLTRNRFAIHRIVLNVAILLFVITAIALSSYPLLLASFLSFPVNLFRIDIQTASFFFSEYLGWNGFWPPLITLTLAFILFKVLPRFPFVKQLAFIPMLVAVLALFSLGRSAPQPFVYSAQKTVASWLSPGKRQVPSLTKPRAGESKSAVDSSHMASIDTAGDFRYRHLLMVVMESVSFSAWEKEFVQLRDGFYEKVKSQSEEYSEYYSTNLDTYTALICMLTSEFVPYRAYPANLFERVNRAPNLVRSLKHQGFKTLFISTYEYQPFVPVRSDWDRIMECRDLPANTEMVSVGTSKMESATEDLAALSTILQFVKSNERTFILHTLVYGHSPEWMMKTGVSQLTYYDRYLRALRDGLTEAGLLEQTLFVVVSDHGPRTDPSTPENYHIPLLIYGSLVAKNRDSTFLSHNDLVSIVTKHLTGTTFNRIEKPILTVGHSGQWVYGELSPNGDCQFIDNESGTVLRSGGALNPNELYRKFQAILTRLASKYPK